MHEYLNSYNDSLQKYVDEKLRNENKPYFEDFELLEIHNTEKAKSISHVRKIQFEQMSHPHFDKRFNEIECLT